MRGLTIDRIVVTGSKEQAQEVAGSVHFLDEEVLEQQAYGDVNRCCARCPGMNIVEEEGFGIRPNIGIRGSGTDRNSKITVMEDGVLDRARAVCGTRGLLLPAHAAHERGSR
jgi:Fe(3+) dicitrate transport protein